jgi:hypothetical protein
MAGPTLDTGQQIAYLQLFLLPYLLQVLSQALYPSDPALQKTTYDVFLRGKSWCWPLRGRQSDHPIPKRLRKQKKPSVRFWSNEHSNKTKLWTYLVPIAVTLLKVSCCIESCLRRWRLRELFHFRRLRELPSIAVLTYTALLGIINGILTVRFDLDSYPISINCHVSRCMVNSPHLFKNLQLKQGGEVTGINSGLEIKGIRTFKLKVNDNDGTTHEIKIPNSLYLPDLKRCLLSPQHWVQEAGDNYPLPQGTRMENDDKQCVLVWGQDKYKKLIPFNATSNIPIMYSASSSLANRAYANTFEALKASFFRCEHVLQFPGLCQRDDLAEQEFVAEKISITKKESWPLRERLITTTRRSKRQTKAHLLREAQRRSPAPPPA